METRRCERRNQVRSSNVLNSMYDCRITGPSPACSIKEHFPPPNGSDPLGGCPSASLAPGPRPSHKLGTSDPAYLLEHARGVVSRARRRSGPKSTRCLSQALSTADPWRSPAGAPGEWPLTKVGACGRGCNRPDLKGFGTIPIKRSELPPDGE